MSKTIYKLAVTPTKNKGMSLKTLERIRKYSIIFFIEGKERKERDMYTIECNGAHVYCEKLKYLSHSCDPNMQWMRGYGGYGHFMSIKEIAIDEELTFDYRTTESEISNHFTCGCGTKACGGEI